MSNKKIEKNDINNNNVIKENKTEKNYENKLELIDFEKFIWDNENQEAYYDGKLLKQRTIPHGYIEVNLVGKRFRLHQLIATKYIPNNNTSYTLIDHINENKADNRVINLRWLDNSENMKKSYQLRAQPVRRLDYLYEVVNKFDSSIKFYFGKRKDVASFINRSARAVSFAIEGVTKSSGGYFITRTLIE